MSDITPFKGRVADATMLWWVSAVVLCVTIIGAAWTQENRVLTRTQLHLAGLSVFAFFTGIFGYGLLVVQYIPMLQSDFAFLLGVKPGAPTPFDSELWFFRNAMYLGSGNYVLFIAVWTFTWRHFAARLPKPGRQP